MEGANAGNVADARPAAATPREDGGAQEDERTPLLQHAPEGTTEEEAGEEKKVPGLKAFASRVSHFIGHPTPRDIDDEALKQCYEPNKLATFRVFFQYTGTVLQNHILWKETISTFFIYVVVVALFRYARWDGFKAFVGKESTIRAFVLMFSGLIGLLLSFYTSLNIGRWWAMRLGVQELWSGSSKLTAMLANGVTTDEQLLHAVHRYARCSLFLVYAANQKIKDPIQTCVKRGILREDEADQLEQLGGQGIFPQASAPWAWLTNAVSALHKQGLTMGPPHLVNLLCAVEQGRSGIHTIQTYLETPIPMAYLHVLGLMVKLHNAFVATFYGLICVMHWGGSLGTNEVAIARTVFRAFFMPFLYNALLLINADLTNPFDGDIGDLSFAQFDECMSREATVLIAANSHRPAWMEGRSYAAWQP